MGVVSGAGLAITVLGKCLRGLRGLLSDLVLISCSRLELRSRIRVLIAFFGLGSVFDLRVARLALVLDLDL